MVEEKLFRGKDAVTAVSDGLAAVQYSYRPSTLKPKQPSTDPTHLAWIDAMRPAAAKGIADAWNRDYRAVILYSGPRRMNRKGRVNPDAGPETSKPRLHRFATLHSELAKGLSTGAISVAEARRMISASEFAGDLRVASSREEAVEQFAALLAQGNNAWLDSRVSEGVLLIAVWRE